MRRIPFTNERPENFLYDVFWHLMSQKDLIFLDEKTFYWFVERMSLMGHSYQEIFEFLGMQVDEETITIV